MSKFELRHRLLRRRMGLFEMPGVNVDGRVPLITCQTEWRFGNERKSYGRPEASLFVDGCHNGCCDVKGFSCANVIFYF